MEKKLSFLAGISHHDALALVQITLYSLPDINQLRILICLFLPSLEQIGGLDRFAVTA